MKDVQVFGDWKDGPWMAVRVSKTGLRGSRWVVEHRIPGYGYQMVYFPWKWYRDAWTWCKLRSPRWRSAEKYSEAVRAARRAYR